MLEILDVTLNSIDKVKNFVNVTNKFDFNIYITQGRYIIDAKSIMGIFSLDLTDTLCVQIDVNQEEEASKFLHDMEEFRQWLPYY